eukprot:gene17451-biopygen20377
MTYWRRKLRLYLEHYFPDEQHGFRAQFGCTTAITKLIQIIANARAAPGGRKAVVVASLDAASAFDTVDHNKLLSKLELGCGVKGKALALIRSYLENRKQQVKMKGEKYSNTEPIGPYGVPQGSVLAPLLYTAYTKDLPQHIHSAEVVLYADDCTLVASGDTIEEARDNMTKALAEYHAYATANRILPEPEKTQYLEMAGTWHLQKEGEVAVNMAGAKLKPKQAIKILGVIIDHKLNWEPHSAAMAAKTRGVAHRVWRATNGLKRKHLVQIMQAMAHPILDYAQPALTGPSELAQRITNSAYKLTARLAARARRIKITKDNTTEGRRGYITPADETNNPGTTLSTEVEATVENKAVWILPPTAPLLTRNKWTSWRKRVDCMRATFVFRMWATGRPASLARHLPPPPVESLLPAATKEFTQLQTTTFGGRELRESRKPHASEPIGGQGTGVSTQSFEYWAPRILSRFSQDNPFGDEDDTNGLTDSDSEDENECSHARRAPSDEFRLQRRGYYGHLTEKFQTIHEEKDADGRIIVWTDGSARRVLGKQQAGAGIYYGNNNKRNWGVPVKGRQTNQRAELTAVITAIENDNRPLRIVTDSNYAHGGTMIWRHEWRARAWLKKPTKAQTIDNADLWKRLDRLLNKLPKGHIVTQWTKGHPLPIHLRKGQSTQLDAWGNTAADGLAARAAESKQEISWCEPSDKLRLVE